MTKTLNYKRTITEATATCLPLKKAMDNAHAVYEKAKREYEAMWDEAFKVAKKADRNYDD